MTTGLGITLPEFPPATDISLPDLIYMTQGGSEVAATAEQFKALLAVNRTDEEFIPGDGVTPGTYLPGGASIQLAGIYGAIANLDVYADALPQLDCTLTANAPHGDILGFPNGGIPLGLSKIVVRGGTANTLGEPSDGTVTDAKIATGSKLSNRIFNHPEVADAGSVTTASVAASIAAIQAAGGGTLIFANGSYSGVVLPTNFAGVALDYLGPNVAASLFGEAYGSQFIASRVLRSQNAGGHAGKGNTLFALENTVFGTGGIGPLNADYVAAFSLLKKNASTTTQAGELDAAYYVVRNGGPNSDTTAILADVGQYGVGFNAFYEVIVSLLDSSSSPTKQIDAQSAVLDNRSNVYAGHVLSATVGVLGPAYFAQNVSGSSWSSVLQHETAGIGITFDIPISGGVPSIALYDGLGGKKSLNVTANNLAVVNAAGNAQILNLTDLGVLSAISSVNVASGGNYAINGVQVVGPKIAGYGTPTGNSKLANFPGASATLAQTSAQVAQIVVDLKTHGLLGA